MISSSSLSIRYPEAALHNPYQLLPYHTLMTGNSPPTCPLPGLGSQLVIPLHITLAIFANTRIIIE